MIVTRRRRRCCQSPLVFLLLLLLSIVQQVNSQAGSANVQFCGDDKSCRIAFTESCAQLKRNNIFIGNCCHLEEIVGTGGCRLIVNGRNGICGFTPRCGPCDPAKGCNVEYQTGINEECPNDRFEVLAGNDNDEPCPTEAPDEDDAPAPTPKRSNNNSPSSDSDSSDRPIRDHFIDNRIGYIIGLSIFVIIGCCCTCACLFAILDLQSGGRYSKRTTTKTTKTETIGGGYTPSDEY